MIDFEMEDRQVENDFIGLVRAKYPQKIFERNAKIMLGDNWQELGLEIIDGYAPEEKKNFVEYVRFCNCCSQEITGGPAPAQQKGEKI